MKNQHFEFGSTDPDSTESGSTDPWTISRSFTSEDKVCTVWYLK